MWDVLSSDLRSDAVFIQGHTDRVDASRNQIVKRALQTEATHLFFLDVDQGIPQLVRQTLLSHNRSIVSALAKKRDGTHWLAFYKSPKGFQPITSILSPLIRIDGIGLGCVAIEMEVFRSLEAPWFVNTYSDEGVMQLEHDLSFCSKAQAAGFSIWVDTTCISSHYCEMGV